jgi:hydrogenase maturation protease
VPTLVLGLGNEIAGDDGVGALAARALREQLAGRADVVESSASGMALLELFIGHERALVIDSIQTGRMPAGTIRELTLAEVGRVVSPSLHQTGIPELAAVGKLLGLGFPADVLVLAVEVVDPYTMGAGLSAPVAAALPELVRRARRQVERWESEETKPRREPRSTRARARAHERSGKGARCTTSMPPRR